MSGFILFLLFGVAVVAIAIAKQKREQALTAWSEAARLLGLNYVPGSWFKSGRIHGELDRIPVEIDTFSRSAGQSKQTFTRYRVHFPEALGLGLKLQNEGFLASVGRFFGAQDIEVGDATFDKAVVVKGAQPEAVRAFLTLSRRHAIQRLFSALNGAKIDDNGMLFEKRGLETQAGNLARHIRRMVNVAHDLVEVPEPARTMDQALTARRDGELEHALTLVREIPVPDASRQADVAQLEGEMLYTGGRFAEAAEAFERGREREPDDAELHGWAAHARNRAAEPPEAAAPPPPAPAPEVVGPDAAAVCQALFAPMMLSLEADKVFEERYRNARVRWTGKLLRVNGFAFDLVFGNQPGTRAVVELSPVEGAFGRTAQAVVHLPAAAETQIESLIGQTVTVEGTLVRCDALMRNLFIEAVRVEGESVPPVRN